MNDSLQDLVEKLDSYLPQLAPRRDNEPMANDCYDAAWYLRVLGKWVFEGNTQLNYPERTRAEYLLLAELREHLQRKSLSEEHEFGLLLDSGEALLRIVETVKPPKDGHLGFLRIVREQFHFLQSEFGFVTADEQPTSHSSVQRPFILETARSTGRSLSCSFGLNAASPPTFWIEDLLYLNHDERYLSLPERLDLDTE